MIAIGLLALSTDGRIGERLGSVGEQRQHQVAKGDRQPDGHDQLRDQAHPPPSQRMPDAGVVQPSHTDTGDDAQYRRTDQRNAEGDIEHPGEHRAEGDELTVGEVGEPGGAEDQAEPDGGDGDDQTESQAVDGEPDDALVERRLRIECGPRRR